MKMSTFCVQVYQNWALMRDNYIRCELIEMELFGNWFWKVIFRDDCIRMNFKNKKYEMWKDDVYSHLDVLLQVHKLSQNEWLAVHCPLEEWAAPSRSRWFGTGCPAPSRSLQQEEYFRKIETLMIDFRLEFGIFGVDLSALMHQRKDLSGPGWRGACPPSTSNKTQPKYAACQQKNMGNTKYAACEMCRREVKGGPNTWPVKKRNRNPRGWVHICNRLGRRGKACEYTSTFTCLHIKVFNAWYITTCVDHIVI